MDLGSVTHVPRHVLPMSLCYTESPPYKGKGAQVSAHSSRIWRTYEGGALSMASKVTIS